MAAYNDMAEIGQWIVSHGSPVSKTTSLRKSRMKAGIQLRLFGALLHEALIVFSLKCKEHKNLRIPSHISAKKEKRRFFY
jgi:hypothetical protein